MSALRLLRESQGSLTAKSLRDLALKAYDNPAMADKLAAKVIERELRAGRKPDW